MRFVSLRDALMVVSGSVVPDEAEIDHKLPITGGDREVAVTREKKCVKAAPSNTHTPLAYPVGAVDPVPEEAGHWPASTPCDTLGVAGVA